MTSVYHVKSFAIVQDDIYINDVDSFFKPS